MAGVNQRLIDELGRNNDARSQGQGGETQNDLLRQILQELRAQQPARRETPANSTDVPY